MVIGFIKSNQTVSEGEIPGFGTFGFPWPISVATLRTSEREHRILFHLGDSSTAIVESWESQTFQDYDALFSVRDNRFDAITEEFSLEPGMMLLRPLIVFIRDDLAPEADECFTIDISPVDVSDHRESFSCGDDGYYCLHSLCITDDDGKFRTCSIVVL